MSKTEKLNEEQVFKQELDDDELEAVSGGDDDCTENWGRFTRDGCIKTYKAGDRCDVADFCFIDSIASFMF